MQFSSPVLSSVILFSSRPSPGLSLFAMKSLTLLSLLSSLTGAHAAVASEANTAEVAADAIALNTFKDAIWSAESLPTPLRGPGYRPLIPPSYERCAVDPNGPRDFTYLTPNGLAVTRDRRTSRAIEETDPDDQFQGLVFEPPNNVFSPRGVFDVRLPGRGDRPSRYLAIFKNGEVGWVLRSTNGQTALRDERGQPYVTTVFSVQCDGLSTAGVINGLEFEFAVKDGKLYARGIPPTKKHSHVFSKRQENGGVQVSESSGGRLSITVGLYVLPRLPDVIADPPVTKTCPKGADYTTRDPAPPVTSNGCGPTDWWRWYFAPKLHETFEDACNWVDVCWTDCTQTFTTCNSGFAARLLDRCNERFRTESSLSSCRNLASAYVAHYSMANAALTYEGVKDKYCGCQCADPEQHLCGDVCIYKNDPNNCGRCNKVCPSGCINGVCASTCQNPWSCNTPGDLCSADGATPNPETIDDYTDLCLCAEAAESAGNVCAWAGDVCGAKGCAVNSDCEYGSACILLSCCRGTPGVCISVRDDYCNNPALPRNGLLRSQPEGNRLFEGAFAKKVVG
ncbi:hypothetical protein QC764_408067 [Podospora pseudoanserina]|uniref:4Fe-4S ferredoxin-type domain-containing protein n=1 Tax=Podospora pseudoanserina TaxID=2609844 RepID=A0ABR0IAA3_9PEZI|nr:hypothetical protein QC764_408067 [Podospora pseudoanserina]